MAKLVAFAAGGWLLALGSGADSETARARLARSSCGDAAAPRRFVLQGFGLRSIAARERSGATVTRSDARNGRKCSGRGGTPEPHSERAMGAALTRPAGIGSASARARACGV